MKSEAGSRFVAAALAVLAVVVLAAYYNAVSAPFLLDDALNVGENPSIRDIRDIGAVLSGTAKTGVAGRPVSNLTFAVNWAMGGANPAGYHFVNILIHLANALLLFGVVRRSLILPGLSERYGGSALSLAFFSALLWAAHPLATEAVTYVTQRIEALMAFFFLLVLYCSIRAALSQRPILWHLGAFCAMVLGAGSKEVIVAAPVMVFLFERTFRGTDTRTTLKRSPVLYGGLAAGLVVLVLLVSGGGTSDKAYAASDRYSWLTYFLNQPEAVARYIRLAVWPNDLVFDYGWPSDGLFGKPFPPPLRIAAYALPLALIVGAAVWGSYRRRAWSFPVLWFFVILGPTSSVLPLWCVAAEQRAYLPLAGLVVLFVFGVHGLFKRVEKGGLWAAVSLSIVAVALAVATYGRNSVYATELSIWADTVQKLPGNSRAWTNLGKSLYYRNRPDEAKKAYQKALEINPGLASAHSDYGALLAETGDFEGGLAHLREAARLTPLDSNIRRVMGEVFLRRKMADKAITEFKEALRLDPASIAAKVGLGAAYLTTGLTQLAERTFREICAQEPGLTDARVNLAVVLLAKKDADGALHELRTAHQLDPGSVRAALALAELLQIRRYHGEAVEICRRVLLSHPGHPGALRMLERLSVER